MTIGKTEALISLQPDTEFVVSGDVLRWDSPDISQPTDAEIAEEISRLTNAEPMRLLRLERDKRLHDCDWWASSDLEITQDQIDYRQALRDIPANTPDPNSPVWPIAPE
jgi:hypothetical protein